MDVKIIKRERHSREDGYLVELFSKKYREFEAIHSYLVSVEPGKTRAGHFHRKKTEMIYPVNGKISVLLKDIQNGERKEVLLNPDKESYAGLLIKPNIAHLLKNISSSITAKIVVFSDSFDLEDTYPVKVEE